MILKDIILNNIARDSTNSFLKSLILPSKNQKQIRINSDPGSWRNPNKAENPAESASIPRDFVHSASSDPAEGYLGQVYTDFCPNFPRV